MTGETATTAKEAVSQHSQSTRTDTEFISEDVYAKTRGSFTKVTCKQVYAFQSIATSNDFSENATSLQSLLQIGVEIEYPNGTTDMLVFQPSNLLHYPIEHRRQLVEQLFGGGDVWISEHDELFTSLFPKTWGIMVVPDTGSVESIFSYRDSGVTSLYSDGKEQAFSFVSGLGLLLGMIAAGGAGGMALIATDSIYPILGGVAVYFGLLKYGLNPLLDYASDKLDVKTPHLWAQRMSPEESEKTEITAIDSGLKESVQKILTQFPEPWTEATVLSVDESTEETKLRLLTKETATEFEITCKTPADSSDRYLLNRLSESVGVGSVRMLEGEQLCIGLSSLGREDNVTKNKTYKLKAAI